MDEKHLYWVWLSLLSGISSRKKKELLECFGSPRNLWFSSRADLIQNTLLTEKMTDYILDPRYKVESEKMLKKLNDIGARIIAYDDSEYPSLLKAIYDPPVLLYAMGEIPTDVCFISVVGSRRATSYGMDTAFKLSYEMAKHGICVVSGMARGIDSKAHLGALKAGGKTIAVLGCGIDTVYPEENKKLRDKIIENGAVITEYLPGTPPLPYNFPARNRIISGMSKGVVIVEASEGSGSLFTADFALEQGREVFAVPGNINCQNSRGTNMLIRDGAKMVLCTEDILEEFYISFNKNTTSSAKRQLSLNGLNTDELMVVNELEGGVMHVDQLSERLNMDCSSLGSLLLMLELKGVVEEIPGKRFKLMQSFQVFKS